MYGERDEPYAVLTRLSQRLEAALAPDAVLSTIVETVAQALKLPYAAILLRREQSFVVAASYGQPREDPLILPLIYQAETMGQLHFAPRAPGETFSPADKRLLDELARHAGLAAHAVRLTSDLQHAREHLVTAREEERRRLRRDLHDGLGSALTSVMFKLDATDELLERDPAKARALLADVRVQTQASITDIRRLVYNLRPPILDEWGLLAALREHIAQYALQNVQVSLYAPESLPPLPAAVEVAVYRMVLEALANVIKHAQAAACTIRLALLADALTVKVQDNGVEAVKKAEELQPDIILMDLQMPKLNGIEATRRILQANPHIGILVLTMLEDDDSVFGAMRVGTRGYVLKGAGKSEVVRAITVVAHGEAIFSPQIAQRLMQYFTNMRPVIPEQAFPDLTDREREVLSLIVDGKTNAQIADILALSPKTVSNHISNIFSKLQVVDRAQAVSRARQSGLS